jgi:hypothetical protein
MKKLLAVGLIVWLATGAGVRAHDIPADVVVQAFLRPEGQRLDVLVRIPLAAMRDIQFPQRGPGFLEIDRADSTLREAARTWVQGSLNVYENGERVLEPPSLDAIRVSLPSDRSFASFESATAHLRGPSLPPATELAWNQALLDVWLAYPIRSDRSDFAIDAGFARLGLRVATVLRFRLPDGPERVFEYLGNPGLVRLDPRWHQAAARFVALGFDHILHGIDHLLFLLCLVLPFRRLKPLVLIVTSFTVAHSITLIAAAMDLGPSSLWFPPLIETLIAASILYMALENVVWALGRKEASATDHVRVRWMMTFAFGLVHGFGFSFALKETLQFAGSHVVTSLFAFNVGVELGQLVALAVLLPVLRFAFSRVVQEWIGIVIVSALVAHTAWHWMIDRGSGLGAYDWSALRPDTPAMVLRWLMAAVMVAGAIWLLRGRRSTVAVDVEKARHEPQVERP